MNTVEGDLSSLERTLCERFEHLKVVDTHEHIGPENGRTALDVDVVQLFAWPYTGTDLTSAGMPPRPEVLGAPRRHPLLADANTPLEERWRALEPYLEHIRFGSYARAVFLTVRDVYGFNDINASNCADISAAMQEENTSGIYDRILREKCGIDRVLTCVDRTDLDSDLLVPVVRGVVWGTGWACPRSHNDVEARADETGTSIKTLEDYRAAMGEHYARSKKEGMAGIKIMARDLPGPDPREAEACFKRIARETGNRLPETNPLRACLTDELCKLAAELDVVVAVHTGMWVDFRRMHPTFVIPLLQRHPDTRFDIYHAGMPWVREAGLMGKNFPNAYLNLCWSHIISPRMAVSALDEWLDMVPANKLIAFGGDYGTECVECAYGHLQLARANVARVLARRIAEGHMGREEAVALAGQWFYHVPQMLYRLGD